MYSLYFLQYQFQYTNSVVNLCYRNMEAFNTNYNKKTNRFYSLPFYKTLQQLLHSNSRLAKPYVNSFIISCVMSHVSIKICYIKMPPFSLGYTIVCQYIYIISALEIAMSLNNVQLCIREMCKMNIL